MPLEFHISDDGYVVFYNLSDPLTPQDFTQSFTSLVDHLDSVDHRVYYVVDSSHLHQIPMGFLSIRNNPMLTHKNSTFLAAVGASPIAKNVAEMVFRLTHYQRTKFFNETEEALGFIGQLIHQEQTNRAIAEQPQLHKV